MDVKEFFEKAKAICEHYSDEECTCCPLDEFCDAGIFAMNSEKAERVIDIVKGFDFTQLNGNLIDERKIKNIKHVKTNSKPMQRRM